MKKFKDLLEEIVEERPGYISKFLDQPPARMKADYAKKNAGSMTAVKQALVNKRKKRKQFKDAEIQAVTREEK